MSTRTRILDSYQAILLEEGERSATVEAVASHAGVSKGGLLYHFGSKEQLSEALIQRLSDLVDADVEMMRAAPEGPAQFYVRTSAEISQPLNQTFLAVSRLAQSRHQAALAALAEMQRRWVEVIKESVPDPSVARVIDLIGTGLYSEASFTGAQVGLDAAARADLGRILEVVDQLIEG